MSQFRRLFASLSSLNSFLKPVINATSNAPTSALSTALETVQGSSPASLLTHFVRILTKNGNRRDELLARVNGSLRQKYAIEHPIQAAVEAIKPVLKYQRFKNARHHVPIVLHPKSAESIAIRWIVAAALNREHQGKRSLERGLFDEMDAILQGNSPVYQKRLNFHRNPN
jgi:ribosomal protein S7